MESVVVAALYVFGALLAVASFADLVLGHFDKAKSVIGWLYRSGGRRRKIHRVLTSPSGRAAVLLAALTAIYFAATYNGATDGLAVTSTPTSSQRATPSDIVVELDLTPSKALTIRNVGPQDVTEWQITLSRYELDASAFAAKELKILPARTSSSGGPWGGALLKAHTDIGPIELGHVVPFFVDPPTEVIPLNSPAMTTFTCVRVTFRDPRSGQRYAAHRVTSVLKGPSLFPDDLDPKYVATVGTNELSPFMRGITPLIVADQQDRFNDGARIYDAN
jgi:hypothetical protein